MKADRWAITAGPRKNFGAPPPSAGVASDRENAALRKSVRNALRLSSGVLAATLAFDAARAAQPFPAVLELSSLDGTNGFVLNGIAFYDSSGVSVSAAGDFNDDGVDDLIIGAIGADPDGRTTAGESYIVFGGGSVGNVGSMDLSTLDGSNGLVLRGIAEYDEAGIVSGAGDLNGDGIADILIGAIDADPHQRDRAGQAYLVFGGAGVGASGVFELTGLDGMNGFMMDGTHLVGLAGISVSSAGDVNGDGYADAIVSARWADPGGRFDAGQAYVVFGGPNAGNGGELTLTLLDGTNGFVINGIDIDDYMGSQVGGAGDVNNDGFDDVILGAPFADPDGKSKAGEAYVVFGHVGPFPAHVELSTLDGTDGFVMAGPDAYGDCGRVSGAGDVNGDGVDDVIIGAYRAQPGGVYDAGKTYVVFGRSNIGSGGAVDLSALDGGDGFVLNGVGSGDQSGYVVGRAGDLNGDGNDDLVIGAHLADPRGRTDAGVAYVVYGRPDLGDGGSFELSALDGENGFIVNGVEVGDRAGAAATIAGDINADGVDDLIIGAPAAEPPNDSQHAGESYVIFGRALDSDSDSIADPDDNCTLVANTNQRDTDGDGYGNACDPDLDNSGFVNFTDLGLLKSVFFTTDPDADFNGDSNVNFADLGIMKSFFFQPPGPSGQAE